VRDPLRVWVVWWEIYVGGAWRIGDVGGHAVHTLGGGLDRTDGPDCPGARALATSLVTLFSADGADDFCRNRDRVHQGCV
jgi:hypothetical protein